jgi:hypothetical protein
MTLLRAAAVASLLALTACATEPFRVADPDSRAENGSRFPGQATLVVLRGSDRTEAAWAVRVRIDKALVGSVRRERYLVLPVAAGTHTLGFDCNFLCYLPAIAVAGDFAAGKTYYFAVEPSSSYNMLTTEVVQLLPAQGAARMATYQPGKTASETAAEDQADAAKK